MKGVATERWNPSPASILLLALCADVVLCTTLILKVGGLLRPWWIIEAGALAWLLCVACVAYCFRPAPATLWPLFVLLAAVCMQYLCLRPGGWFGRLAPQPTVTADNPLDICFYWRAGLALRENRNPYEDHGYLYPPPTAQFFRWLAGYDAHLAFAAWFNIVLASMLASVLLTYQVAAALTRSALASAVLAFLLWIENWPAASTVDYLQVNLIVLALLLLAWDLHLRKSALSGIPVAAACFIKIIPVVPALFMFLSARGKARWAAAFALSVAVMAAASLAVGPAHLWLSFFPALLNNTMKRACSLRLEAVLSTMLPASAAEPLAMAIRLAVLAGAVAMLLAYSKARADSRRPTSEAIAPALGCLCMIVVSPIVWHHWRVLFVPPLLAAWAFASERRIAPLIASTAALIWLPQAIPPVGPIMVWAAAALLMWLLSPAALPQRTSSSAVDRVCRAIRFWACN